MDAQRLSHRLDSLIADMLEQRRRRLQTHGKVMRVILSGEDLTTLPTTLDCLTALDKSGYLLVMAFSHSAMQVSLPSSCLQALTQRGVDVLRDDREPWQTEDAFTGLYLPSLSTNSLSKIALGIRDNRVCRWAFHALSLNKPLIVTLNPECQDDAANPLPCAFRARLATYVATLEEYGITVIGRPITHRERRPQAGVGKSLITLSEVRQHPRGAVLSVGHRTLITPAARDEIRDRGIVIAQSHQEDICIWQK